MKATTDFVAYASQKVLVIQGHEQVERFRVFGWTSDNLGLTGVQTVNGRPVSNATLHSRQYNHEVKKWVEIYDVDDLPNWWE